MHKKLKFFIYVLVALVFLYFIFYILFKPGPVALSDKMFLFYSSSCPHCQEVKDFMQKNNVKDRLEIVEEDVTNNRNYLNQFIDTARFCKIQTSSIPIPLLFDGKQCVTGDVDIINYLKQNMGPR